MVKKLVYSAFVLLGFLSACSDSADTSQYVARVYDAYLSRSEVNKAIPFGTSPKDSAQIAAEYIKQWIKSTLVLYRAENNLTEEQKDVQQQLEDYRKSLLIYAYERELIRQKLDTIVNDAQIEEYYKKYPGNFELKSNIIRLKYIKLPVNTPSADKVASWFNSTGKPERIKLEEFCKTYAVNYVLDDANWLLLEDVIKEIPLEDYSSDDFNNEKRMLDFTDEEYRYLVKVTGFMVKESKAPLSFERNNIRSIILNKRKIKLIEQMQTDVYNEALNEKDAEMFAPAP
jgi:hypothetical protein